MRLVDADRVCAMLDRAELEDCYMEYNERRRERVKQAGATGYLVVVDAQGVGLAHVRAALRHAQRAAQVLEMGERHFPGSIRLVVVVNAHPLCHAVYTAVRPALGAATRESITITGRPASEVALLGELLPPGMLDDMRAELPR